jgi:16S rRNA (uracil1498-N3)-methyltransferase
MRVPRIFSDQDFSVGQNLQLDAFASGHICRVLRMKEGRPLILFNGRGGEYSAVLKRGDPKKALVELVDFDPVERESNLKIHLGLALSRGDRFDWAIQKSVELGVSKVTPLSCARSDHIFDAKRLARKMDHWKKLIVSACEQSGRTRIPDISEPHSCMDWCQREEGAQGYFFVPGKPGIGAYLADTNELVAGINLAIGPEGGFTEEEEGIFCAQDFHAVSLGPRVLRTETAPIVAISLFQNFCGDIS